MPLGSKALLADRFKYRSAFFFFKIFIYQTKTATFEAVSATWSYLVLLVRTNLG